ncbi:MAG: hypothetical protein BMS9Abin05_1764 [Rhodothermia bacterium]|nr:MAG: hypothetical protein BMS9Abin05_1764 [Rhodothermia bacterium]
MLFPWSTSWQFLTRTGVLLTILLASGIAAPSAPFIAPSNAQDRRNEVQDSLVEQLLIRGLTRLYLEDFEGAVSVFDEALKLRPYDSALLSSMVKAQMGLGDFSSARFFIGQAIDNDSRNASVWDLAAELSVTTGDFPELLHARQQLSQLRKKNASAHLDLIRLLSRLERFDDALKATSVALNQVGNDPRILLERVTVLEKLGRIAEMDRTLIRLSELEPSVILHRERLGASYIRQSKWEKAESTFRSILALEPDHLEAGTSLSVVLNHLGRSGEGRTILAEINSMNQTVVEAPENRVDLSTSDGLAAASDDQLRAWLTEHPTHKKVLQELAERLVAQGDALQAADLYARIVANSPREIEIWVAAIDAYLEGGNNERALETARRGLALFPGYVPLRIGQTQAWVGAGQTESALGAIQKLLNQVTDPDQKAVLNALLEQIESM